MMMLIRRIRRLALLSIAAGLMAAGCSEVDHAADPSGSSEPALSASKPNHPAKKEKPEKKDLTISSPTETESSAQDEASEDKGSNKNQKQEKSGKKEKKEPAKLPNYDVTEPFDLTKPTLMGFTVGESIDGVTARFGKSESESTMNDGGQVLQVLEYPGFTFGVGDNKSIIFIEVTTDQINPGLNQFRVGQTVDEAQKALGPANSLNEFVMIYEADGLVLKCDLDPNTKKVLSIKLFAA